MRSEYTGESGKGRSRQQFFYVLLFSTLLLIMVLSAVGEYRLRRASVLSLMADMSHSLAAAVDIAAENSILQYDKLLEETENRMAGALWALDQLEGLTIVDSEIMEAHRLNHALAGLQKYSADAVLQEAAGFSIDSEIFHRRVSRFLASGQSMEVFGFIPGAEQGKYFGLAVRRSLGGAYSAFVDGSDLSAVQRNLGIAALLNSIIEDETIKYIAIQDSLGIIAASRNIRELSSFRGDLFLNRILDNSEFDYRSFEFMGELIYESAMPFQILDSRSGIIRIGLDRHSLDETDRSAHRNILIRFSILLFFAFFLIAYSVIRQNNRLLLSEKEKITAEVYSLQEDLRQRERIGAMWELAAGVAHEIRNPLNAMGLSAQRLAKKLEKTGQTEEGDMVARIRNEIRRLDGIIRQFMQFSRPAPPQIKTFDTQAFFFELEGLYSDLLEERRILWSAEIEGPKQLQADRDKLKQVMVNLIVNAVQAVGSDGQISLRCSELRDSVLITVKDSGPGIPEQDLPKIFNLYFSTKEEGGGLGLSTVYQIITAHRGSIEVHSQLGKGSEFRVRLPLNPILKSPE